MRWRRLFETLSVSAEQKEFTHRAAVNFINHVKDLLLAFSLPLVLVDVTEEHKDPS